MLILITYDVSTTDGFGKKRLQKVAKYCKKYGQRVQNSVFECVLNEGQFVKIKHDLENVIDKDKDSLRFYNLGNAYNRKVEHFGAKPSYDAEGVLLL